MATVKKDAGKKKKLVPLGKPFVVGEFVEALMSIAGCTPGDFAKVTELKHDGALVRCQFVTGVKAGTEVLVSDKFVSAVAPKALPANVKSVLKIKSK